MDKIFLLLLVVCISPSFCFNLNAVNSKLPVYCSTSNLRRPCLAFKVVNLRSTVILSCPLVATHNFSLRQKDLVSLKNYYNILAGNNLTIPNFRRSNDREYICVAKNGSGHYVIPYLKWVVIINPRMPPKRPPFKTETLVGFKQAFSCHAKKSEKEVYLMYSKSKDIHKARKFYDASRLRFNRGTFQIKNLTTNDTGYYYCGKKTSTDIVKVLLGELIVRDWPRISYPRERHAIVKGRARVRFVCLFSGSADISWYKNGKNVTRGRLDKKANKLKLTIKDVNENDAGVYQCRVTIGGKTVGPSRKLSVFAFRYATVVPQGLLAPNSSTNVTCATTANIIPTQVYFRGFHSTDYKEIKPDNKKYFDVASNIISIADLNKQDEGEYECRATLFSMHIKKKAGEVRLTT